MPRTSRNVRATEVATTAIPPTNAATDSTVDTTTAPTIASADAAQHASHITSAQLGAAGIADKVPSSVVTNDGDISVTPISENAAQLASSNQPASVISNPAGAASVSIVNPSALRCQQCGAEFSSMTQLAEHVRTEHRTGAGSLVTSPAINQAIESWLLTWEDLRLLAPTIATDALNKYMGESVAKAPLLIIEDSGLCTSFLASDTVSIAGLQRELVGFTWFMETLQMIPALPEGAVNHLICHTGWASKDSASRNLNVRLSPPTHGAVSAYTTVLSKGYVKDMQFNLHTFRANALMLSLKFVLSNLKINKSTPLTQDQTPRSRGRYIRFHDDKELLAVAYPGREVLMEANRNALFLDEAIPDRVGRIGRAQNVSGDVSAHIDTYELCDDLTLAIREMYHNMLFSMHLDPASVMEIVQDVSQQLVAASIPFAQTDTILCPWAASSPTLQLGQVLNLLNVANNTSAALPLIEAAATLIMGITPLRMEPRILSEAIKRVPETTTIVPSPTGELTRLLKPLGNDYSAFYRCIAGWLYSGIVQTFISADSYPDPTQSITSIPAIWKSLIVTLAAPMTTDPHAAVKAFMSMANLLAQPEPIIIPAPGMTQSTPAVQFGHPEVWPPGFIDPTTLDRNRTPLLHALATMIHAHWPQPGVIPYGSARLGSANLFLPANQLAYPWPTQPLPRITVGPTYDSAMSRWIDNVFGFYINVVNSRYVATIVGDTTRRTLIGLMSALRQVKTMTPFYIERMCPTEIAVVGGVTVVPPFQVPFSRLDPDQVITNVMVSRVDPQLRADVAVDPIVTMPTLANSLPVDPAAIVVAMLCGQTDATLVPSYHYGSAITPMFLSEGIFTRNQRAVIASEAFVCARSIIAQCIPDGFQVPRPLQAFNQYNASGSTAADLLKAVDDMFKTAFDLDGSLIEGIGLYGDPRVADLSVAYIRQNGAVERVHTAPDSSFIHEAMQVTSQVMINEPNLWAIARGDVILAQNATNNNWDPMNPVGLPLIVRGAPGVRVVGQHGMIIPQPGGFSPMIRDETGNPQPIDGDWIYPISVLQVSVANFRDHVWPMIQTGRTRVRIEMGHFLYSIHYHEPFGQITEAPALDAWLAGISPTGVPPFPFSAPIPQINIPITARRVYFGYCTMNNNGATFSTLGAAIQSAWGTDVTIQRNRWPALIDPAYIPGHSQLPARIQLYNPLRRYNYRYPVLKGMLYIPGVE
ncbi:VP3 [Scophthalmus maximus reovirus]|uniref:VP3 n=1 Tax=Scophthalmus maximus reovirus TaxID=994485 RepID=F2WJK8_9REOV|nr:VP3 [Scophthalmus maximus reovirus]ADZ31978.1 VP3 [Scophthalmus maximus reovirus]